MMYWPRPHELRFRLSPQAAVQGLEIVHADILAVDRCWRASVADEYVPHTKTYHYEEIDQKARDGVLANPDRLEIPEVQMLGNSHLSFRAGGNLFALLREMVDLGYMQSMPFALWPEDAAKFRYYFRSKDQTPYVEGPMLALYGDDHASQGYR